MPARCELIIRLRGPLPQGVRAGTEIFFNQDVTDLSFNGNKYILDGSYSYILTADDVANGQSSDWSKDLYFSVPQEKVTYLPLVGISYYDTTHTLPIKCFQGERRTIELLGTANMDMIGEPGQYYDIDDLDFSNWYGKRDPFGWRSNVFYPELSWCKVGIGADAVDALRAENLFTIEDQSIYLNEQVVNTRATEPPQIPYKVCLIDTNSDKTVRLSFSVEPALCDIGLKSYKDNIYVQYIATNGRKSNTVGVKGSIMTHNNMILVSVDGSVINMTNNVQFIINSDIYGGEYFENQDSIRINAPAYFSSRGKLVTKDDFTSYFRALTTPITVQNALVYGQMEIEKLKSAGTEDLLHVLAQNNIFYSLIGHLYVKNDGNWKPRNLLTDYDSNNDAVTIYGDQYREHLCDFIKMLYSYEGYFNKIYREQPRDERWIKNVDLIYDNIKHKMEINSILLPMVPFFQYFDIVGTVTVDPLTDIAKYTTDMKNKVYEYLDKKAAKDRRIYKSEIVDLYNQDDRTKSVDIDIKISDIIQSKLLEYKWSGMYNADFRVNMNENVESYLQENFESAQKSVDKYGYGWWNEIVISKNDESGKTLNAEMFKNRSIEITIEFLDYDCSLRPTSPERYSAHTDTYNLICDVLDDDEYIKLYPKTIQRESGTSQYTYRAMTNPDYREPYDGKHYDWQTATQDGIIRMTLGLPAYADFYSMSGLSEYNVDEYKISRKCIQSVIKALDAWLGNDNNKVAGANRAIPLDYEVKSNKIPTRVETITRRGHLITEPAATISEQSFWQYFVEQKVLNGIYADTETDKAKIAAGMSPIDVTTDYDSEEWKAACNLIMDIYPLVKPGICDSILDDNNNIVNFSTDMELPIVYNKINVKYNKN